MAHEVRVRQNRNMSDTGSMCTGSVGVIWVGSVRMTMLGSAGMGYASMMLTGA
jgi:hypothetical protein